MHTKQGHNNTSPRRQGITQEQGRATERASSKEKQRQQPRQGKRQQRKAEQTTVTAKEREPQWGQVRASTKASEQEAEAPAKHGQTKLSRQDQKTRQCPGNTHNTAQPRRTQAQVPRHSNVQRKNDATPETKNNPANTNKSTTQAQPKSKWPVEAKTIFGDTDTLDSGRWALLLGMPEI